MNPTVQETSANNDSILYGFTTQKDNNSHNFQVQFNRDASKTQNLRESNSKSGDVWTCQFGNTTGQSRSSGSGSGSAAATMSPSQITDWSPQVLSGLRESLERFTQKYDNAVIEMQVNPNDENQRDIIKNAIVQVPNYTMLQSGDSRRVYICRQQDSAMLQKALTL